MHFVFVWEILTSKVWKFKTWLTCTVESEALNFISLIWGYIVPIFNCWRQNQWGINQLPDHPSKLPLPINILLYVSGFRNSQSYWFISQSLQLRKKALISRFEMNFFTLWQKVVKYVGLFVQSLIYKVMFLTSLKHFFYPIRWQISTILNSA